MTKNSREKHGKHYYTIEMYGLKQEDLDNSFTAYREYFGIESSNR